jgi:hypothetical protein
VRLSHQTEPSSSLQAPSQSPLQQIQPGVTQPRQSQAEQQTMVQKCARFFKTLIHLSQQPDQAQGQGTAVRVKELVRVSSSLIFPSSLFIAISGLFSV